MDPNKFLATMMTRTDELMYFIMLKRVKNQKLVRSRKFLPTPQPTPPTTPPNDPPMPPSHTPHAPLPHPPTPPPPPLRTRAHTHTYMPIKIVLFCMQSTWFHNFCRTSPYVFQSRSMILNVDEGEGWVWRGAEGREGGTAVHVQKFYTPSCALRSSPQSLLAIAFRADTAVAACSDSTV